MNYNLDALKNEAVHTRVFFEETIYKVAQKKSLIAYCNEALASNIEKWERKEFTSSKADYEKELEEHESNLKMLIETYPKVADENYTGETVFLYWK